MRILSAQSQTIAQQPYEGTLRRASTSDLRGFHIAPHPSQALAEQNASVSEDAESSRALLGVRSQELAELAARSALDAAAANRTLSDAEASRAEERKEARIEIAGLTQELADAAASAKEAEERSAEEAGKSLHGDWKAQDRGEGMYVGVRG